MKVEISNHAILINVNKPLLGNLIERPLTIKGLSWKSRKCTKIEHICLRTNSLKEKVYVDEYFIHRTCRHYIPLKYPLVN